MLGKLFANSFKNLVLKSETKSIATQIPVNEVDFDKLDENSLKDMALAEAERIFQKLEAVDKKIKDAKDLAKEAEKLNNRDFSDWVKEKVLPWEDTALEKQSALNTKSNKVLAEAMKEQTEIIKESIKFTQLHSKFSQAMIGALTYMLKNGFKDSHGRFIKLSQDATETAEYILQQTEQFVRAEEDKKQTFIKIEKNIDEVEEDIDKIEQNIDEVEKEVDELQESDALQKEQIAANTEAIKRLEAKNQSKISLYTSILTLLVSLASLVLHFI